jgi:hypothetical protein
MQVIQNHEQLVNTVLLATTLATGEALKRRFLGPEGPKAVESVAVRLSRLALGEQFSERLVREGKVSLGDFWAALRHNIDTSPIPLGLRVRAVLALLVVGYLASGGVVLRPETVLAIFIAQTLRPTEWSASSGRRLDAANLWRAKLVAIGAVTLGVWAISELLVGHPSNQLFWIGWLAHAIVLGRVAWKRGPGHGSRRLSPIGWTLIGISQLSTRLIAGPPGVTLAALTCMAALYAAWGAYTERLNVNA